MNDTETSEFKMHLDGGSPESELQKEVDDLRISKLSQRVTLISILIPCMFIAIILFLYLDAKKEVTATFQTGSQEIQNLSEKIESRFSEMTLQNKKQEEEFNKKTSVLEKALADLIKTVKNLDGSKASKTLVSSSVTQLSTSLDSLKSDLKLLSDEIKTLDKNLKENLSFQNKKNEVIQAELSRVSSSKVDRKELQKLLADHEKASQKELDQIYKNIESKLNSIQSRINTLEGIKPSSEKPSKPAKDKTEAVVSPDVTKPKPVQTNKPPEKQALPQSGNIYEQDVQ